MKQTLLIPEFFQSKQKLNFFGLKLTYFYFFFLTKLHLQGRERLVSRPCSCYHAVSASHPLGCSLSISFLDKLRAFHHVIILLYVLTINCRGSNTRINNVNNPSILILKTNIYVCKVWPLGGLFDVTALNL